MGAGVIGHNGRIAVKHNAGLAIEGVFLHFPPDLQAVFHKTLGRIAIAYAILFRPRQVNVAKGKNKFVLPNRRIQAALIGQRNIGANGTKRVHVQHLELCCFQSTRHSGRDLDGAGRAFAIVLKIDFVAQVFAFRSAKTHFFARYRNVVGIVRGQDFHFQGHFGGFAIFAQVQCLDGDDGVGVGQHLIRSLQGYKQIALFARLQVAEVPGFLLLVIGQTLLHQLMGRRRQCEQPIVVRSGLHPCPKQFGAKMSGGKTQISSSPSGFAKMGAGLQK